MSTVSTNMLQLPVAVGLDGTEYVWIVQGGTDKRATVAQIAELADASGAFIQAIIVTDLSNPGAYTVPDSALKIVIDKTDGADVVLPALASKVGAVQIIGAQATAFPFNVVVTDGTIMGALSSYAFNADYQSVTFMPVTALATWTT